MQTEGDNTPEGIVGLAFAKTVAAEDFVGAHAMLSNTLAATVTPADIEASYRKMIGWYEAGPPTEFGTLVDDEYPLGSGEVGWAYVWLNDEQQTYCEAVSVTIVKENGRLAINSLEWGRP
jgi:hypothetical protein